MNVPKLPRQIAALCVSGRSIYKHTAGVLAYDRLRDARTFPGGIPVVAHPPCRCWSKYLSHQAKPVDRKAEMDLGLWCVEQVIEHGGVLEHPAHSRLFDAAKLPLPNRPAENPFLFTLYIEQAWFGFATRKPTWVLVSGVPKHLVPALPFLFRDSNSTDRLIGMSAAGRSRTIGSFAEWLCQTARETWWSMPTRQLVSHQGKTSRMPNSPDGAIHRAVWHANAVAALPLSPSLSKSHNSDSPRIVTPVKPS